ncbi:MAG: hypothetical protein LUE61_10175 [Clostridiales bacterium]|nr:hypothetical protein [Clostridiales bacterium]
MKGKKASATLFFIASVCFYIAAIIGFFSDGDFSVVYLCLGSAFLCIGAAQLNRDDNDTDKKENDDQ